MSRDRVRIERGLYQDGAIYYACATPPGSRSATWKSLGAVGRMEARRLRDEFVADVRRGRAGQSTERRGVTFAVVADEWLATQRALVDVGELAQRTVDGYELSVRRHLRPWFGTRPIRAVVPNDLVAWHAAQRRSGAAAWSIKGRWNALRGVLAYAVREDVLAGNPADVLTSREKPKPGPSRKRFLSEEEMRRLRDVATGREHLLIAVLLFAGLRISEALGLVWQDVDLDTGHLRVRYQLGRDGPTSTLVRPALNLTPPTAYCSSEAQRRSSTQCSVACHGPSARSRTARLRSAAQASDADALDLRRQPRRPVRQEDVPAPSTARRRRDQR